jgi:hypothetical protein
LNLPKLADYEIAALAECKRKIFLRIQKRNQQEIMDEEICNPRDNNKNSHKFRLRQPTHSKSCPLVPVDMLIATSAARQDSVQTWTPKYCSIASQKLATSLQEKYNHENHKIMKS